MIEKIDCFSQEDNNACSNKLLEELFRPKGLEEYAALLAVLAVADYLEIESFTNNAYDFNNQKIRDVLSEMIYQTQRNQLKTYKSPEGEMVKKLIDLQNRYKVTFFDVNLILKDINYPNWSHTLLTAFTELGDKEAVDLVIKSGADRDLPNSLKRTALIVSADKGFDGIVDLLIAADTAIDITDFQNDTALMRAAKNGHANIVVKLLKAGAYKNHQNDSGFSALITAANNGQITTVQTLLEASVDVSLETKWSKMTALNWAANKGLPDIVKLLLKAGLNVHHEDADGTTPLIKAVKRSLTYEEAKQRREVVELLLKAGANVDHKNKNGTTVLDCALKLKLEKMVILLEKHKEPQGHSHTLF